MECERGSVESISSGLRDDGNRGSSRHTLLGIERVGADIDRLDRLRRWYVHDVGANDVHLVQRAIEVHIIGVSVGAVDVRAEVTLRRVVYRVLEHSRRGS